MYNGYPECIVVDNKKYAVHTDFRNWIKIDELIFGGSLTDKSLAEILALCYKKLPPNVEAAYKEIINFHNLNRTFKKSANRSGSQKRIISFVADEQYVSAAFLSEYKIDLNSTEMHWFKFKSLFDGLPPTQKICEIMNIRAVDIGTIKDKQTKSHYRRLKSLYRLPDNRSEEEKDADIGSLFAKGMGM
ncbi:MAG: hypothetical protein IJ300_06950 [Clostridia bacterium]|nr:hypothetical protein [Clostridia bacterium]